jgi:IclR family transcriptional regulator, acetate operon repressor
MTQVATLLRYLQQGCGRCRIGNRGLMAEQQDCAPVQSVARAIEIVKSFSWERPERGVNELARELGLHKSTVSRLMMTLECGGLLARDPVTDRYRLGIDLIGLASQVISHLDVREIARPYLRELADNCQETVNLVVLDAGQVVNLEQFVPPARRVMNIGWIGRRMPPHCTAAGKVLLAHLPSEDVDRVLPVELERFTPQTITDRRQLRLELVRTLEQGYAVVEEELEEGLNAIAAPIYDYQGEVTAAVSAAGPAYRVTPAHFSHLAEQLIQTSSAISRRLGHSPR